MKAFTDSLYFEPKIEVSDWPMIIEALKVVYPNIRWRSGGQLDTFLSTGPFNGLIVTTTNRLLHNSMYPVKPLLSWGVWNNMEDFAEHVRFGEVKDGWEKLGFKQEFDFDSLTESESIRRIIKESIDEFDWVDVDPNAYTGQGLINLMQDFFQTNGKYYLEQHEFNGLKRIAISDDTGIYYSYHMNDFTIDRIKSDIKTTLEELFHNYEAKVRNEYQQLAKALEPIIGPINSLTESIDEFDWVDTNPSIYDLISNFFKHEHPEYWLEKDFGHVSSEDIFIADKTGNYIRLEESEFTIENIRKTLYKDIINLEKDRSFDLRDEFIQLAKVLEPIIGPINID